MVNWLNVELRLCGATGEGLKDRYWWSLKKHQFLTDQTRREDNRENTPHIKVLLKSRNVS